MSQQIAAEPSENCKQESYEHRKVDLEEELPLETAGRVTIPTIMAGKSRGVINPGLGLGLRSRHGYGFDVWAECDDSEETEPLRSFETRESVPARRRPPWMSSRF